MSVGEPREERRRLFVYPPPRSQRTEFAVGEERSTSSGHHKAEGCKDVATKSARAVPRIPKQRQTCEVIFPIPPKESFKVSLGR